VEYAIGAGMVAIGWSACVVSFAKDFGIDIPSQYISAPFAFDADSHTWSTTGAILNVPAVAVVVAMTICL
jgi:APA family basic amino acid/polyamine antiporter